MSDRRYFVAEETIERLDGRFDAAVEFVHSYEREQEANIKCAHDATVHPSYYYTPQNLAEDVIKELKESPAYDSFTEDDRSNVLRYMNRFSFDEERDRDDTESKWTVENAELSNEGRLFPVRTAFRSIPTHNLDMALLTGWGGLDVLKASGVDINDFQDYGCNSRLQLLQLLGALSSQRMRDAIGDHEAERHVPHGEFSRRIFFGGDMHFDFYMGTAERYPNGSIDPLGFFQDFAPDKQNPKRIHSYHSVEEGLFADLMLWVNRLSDGKFKNQQFELFRDATVRVLEKFSSPDTQRSPFSMGSAQHYETDVDGMIAMEITKYLDDPHENSDGSVSLMGGQLPGGLMGDYFTDVCVEKEGTLSFRTCHFVNGEKVELQRITFDQSELVPLIEISIEHAFRGLGRTSWIRLLSLMAMRFFPEECGHSDDIGYFERSRNMPKLALKLVLGIEPVSEAGK